MKTIKRPTVKTSKYLFSTSRTAKILGIKQNQVEFVMLMDNGKVLVGLFNDHIYLDAFDYKKQFGKERQERAKQENLTVTQNVFDSTIYTVRNESKQSRYQVELFSKSIKCNCADYQISSQEMNTPQVACKHIYSVLNVLGVSTLRDYVKAEKIAVSS